MSAPFLIRNMADCVSRSMMARCSMENMPPSGPGDQELVSQPCSTCRRAHAASPVTVQTHSHCPCSHPPSTWPCPSVHFAGRPRRRCCLRRPAASGPRHAHTGTGPLGTDDGELPSAARHHPAQGNWVREGGRDSTTVEYVTSCEACHLLAVA